jgi:crotonobetainyl-CoA:carnitine CoA-transferase CaiB-like acyl-CoA transferase
MFENLKVLEVASVLAGPGAGMFFAELGANVIKVENPATGGDVTRKWKLPSEDASSNTSAYFASVNYGKTHVFLDLKTDKETFYALVRDADIIICNWKKGDAEKLVVDYNTLKKLNNRLIYAELTGYGNISDRVAYDIVLQAETGWMYMNGTQDSGPVKIPVAIVDLFAAHQLKEGILVALLRRMQTNTGSKVTVSLFDAAIASLANQASNFLTAGYVPQRIGSLHPNIAPYGETMLSADGKQFVLAVGTDAQFQKLCDVLNLTHLKADIRFSINQNRVKNRAALSVLLQNKIREWDAELLAERFEKENIPAGIIRDQAQVFAQANAAKLVLEDNSGKRVKSTIFKLED